MLARLAVSRTIYVNVDSPNLGFRYFNFLGGSQLKKNTLYLVRRCPDVEGIWKVVTKEGEGSFLDACGILEPKKVEFVKYGF